MKMINNEHVGHRMDYCLGILEMGFVELDILIHSKMAMEYYLLRNKIKFDNELLTLSNLIEYDILQRSR